MNPNKMLVNSNNTFCLTIRCGWSNNFGYWIFFFRELLPNKNGSKSFS